jgi:SAM-dependent methyltransferase
MQTAATAYYYDVAFSGMAKDRDFYLSLARQEGGPVCEMGAGSGRIAIAIACAGIEIFGVDISEPMLERFRSKLTRHPAEIAGRAHVIAGDMREWGPDAAVQQVFLAFRSLLALTTREQRHACLTNCFRILRPGGRLALNVFHPSMAYMRQFSFEQEGSWREVGHWPLPEGGTLELVHSAKYDRLEQLIHDRFRWIERTSEGSTKIVEELLELAFLWRDELLLHLEHAGFTIESLWGDFDCSPLRAEGQEMIVVARRPAL